jgi:co-chaperonin GroES (HSP10)
MIRPIGKMMVVKKFKTEEKPQLILVSSPKSEPFHAKLLGKGESVEVKVEVNDILLVSQYGGLQFDKEDQDLYLIGEKEILGVVL